jgi:hypothetical protein
VLKCCYAAFNNIFRIIYCTFFWNKHYKIQYFSLYLKGLKNCYTLKQFTHFQKIRVSIPGRSKRFLFSKMSTRAPRSNQPPIQQIPGVQRPGPRREFNDSPQIASQLRPSAAIPLLPLYAFKALTRTMSRLLLRTVRLLLC